MPLGMGSQDWKLYARYSQFGFELVAPILVGWGLDYWLGTLPWCTVVGAVLGLFYMFWRLQPLIRMEDRTSGATPNHGQRKS